MAVTYQQKNHWYLFIVSPFLISVIAIRNYRATWARNIIWAFVTFYGFTFGVAQENATGDTTADIIRYAQEVKDLYKLDLSFTEVLKLYSENEDLDIFKFAIAVVVSRVTDSQQVLTAIYGFIFGFFFSRNVWFVIDRMRGKIKTASLLLLIVFVLVNPIWNINGFRFHTAVQIFIYGLLPFLYDGKKSSLLMCALTILVHFAFLVPVGVLLFYFFVGNRTLIYFIFFLGSIVSSGIDIRIFNQAVEESAPVTLAERTSGYRSEKKVKQFREGTGSNDTSNLRWYAVLYTKVFYWALMALIIFLFFKRRKLELINSRFLSCLSFSLLFWGVANLLSSLPSGGRFLAVAALMVLPLIILCIQNTPSEKYFTKKVWILSPAFLLFIIVSIRVGFYTFSVNTFISNPLIAIFLGENFILNDLIK